MDKGISFEEACSATPNALTAEQLQNCPGHEMSNPPYAFIGIAASVIVMAAIVVFVVFKLKRSKRSS
jgi:hypothetical protein